MTMGEKIKFHREQNNMTLEELGNKVGVGKSTVRKWENGMIANMRRDKIAKIARALNISPAYLMGWSENPQPLTTATHLEMYDILCSKNGSTPINDSDNQRVNELLSFFIGLSENEQDEVIEFLRLYAGARPDVRDQIVHLLVSLAQ